MTSHVNFLSSCIVFQGAINVCQLPIECLPGHHPLLSNTHLVKYKQNTAHLTFFIFLCIFYTVNGSHIIITAIATLNLTSDNHIYHRILLFPTNRLFSTTHVCHTAGFQECLPYQTHGLLTWYMVTLLYRHKIQSLCLQTTKLPPKASLGLSRPSCCIYFLVISTLGSIICYSRTMFYRNPVLYMSIFLWPIVTPQSVLCLLSVMKNI